MTRRTAWLGVVALLCATTLTAAAGCGTSRPRLEPVEASSADLASPTRVVVEYYPTIRECGGGRMLTPDVEETADSVLVRLTQVVHDDARECPAVAEIGEVTVALERPLAGRVVKDGRSGEPLPPRPWSPFRGSP